ncbi:uncharacterized protein [Amphiura filiformis]|uniref:uncharacterized protein n=1 Tax=Amphiura filiformis TaxID=82378 RepID=UPI003B216785
MPNRRGGRGGRGGGRGRGRGRGRYNRGRVNQPAQPAAAVSDDWSAVAVGAAEAAAQGKESDKEVSLEQLFTSDSTFDRHYAAQETNCNRYLATLLVLQKNGTEIAQVAKIRALAAAWARKDHRLANRLLGQSTQFGLVEVLKALTLLDAGRKIREWEKRMKRYQMQPKVKARKVGQIKSNIDNLGVIRPKMGSVSGALSRHIRNWVRQIPKSQLEFYALHYPKEPWKRLADLCHLNPKKDFPELPWFLPFCFGEAAPDGTMVSKCSLVNKDNLNELIESYEVPYTHIKEHKNKLTNESKKRIAEYETKLDTVLWYYEDLACPEVDEVIVKRMKSGETIGLPYGKLMERLLMLKMLNRTGKVPFMDMLIAPAEARLKETSVSLEAPVVVIGDRSSSMGVAVRTSTIIASVLCAICKAKLCFFNDGNYEPPTMPRDIPQVLNVATSIRASGCTAPAASLWPYYEKKEIVKTFIMVTDEEENTSCHNFRFAALFKKYHDEIYPARLVFVSFLRGQHSRAQMVQELQQMGYEPLQFKLDQNRPDLTKLDNLLGLLAKEAVMDFKEEVDKMEVEIAAGNLADDVGTMKIPDDKM